MVWCGVVWCGVFGGVFLVDFGEWSPKKKI